jgi:DNA topoisomerase-1
MNFHYSPKQTLDIAQTLYTQALISYPRTSSQKLPAKIGYKKILEALEKQDDYSGPCKFLLGRSLRPREGKKEDPAHPAIYPTGTVPKSLNPYQKKIYDLIVRRFLACFAEPAVRESINARIDIEGEKFKTDGVRTVQENWIEFYKPYARFKESILPEMREGERLEVKGLEILDKETQPPKRFTQASILKEMESNSLGTKATRANILQTLYDRGYIREASIFVTQLGESVVSALDKFCPEIVSPDLTRKFEEDMVEIQNEKKKGRDVLGESREALKKILDKFRQNELRIGQELLKGVIESEKLKNTVGKCPKCGKGDLRIIYSKTTHKRFVACNAYPRCRNTFPLPQNGGIMVVSNKCKCGLNQLSVKARGKRPWKLCIKCGFASKFKKKKTTLKKSPAKKPEPKKA